MGAHPNGPERANLLEMKGGVSGVTFQEYVRVMSQRDVVLPAA